MVTILWDQRMDWIEDQRCSTLLDWRVKVSVYDSDNCTRADSGDTSIQSGQTSAMIAVVCRLASLHSSIECQQTSSTLSALPSVLVCHQESLARSVSSTDKIVLLPAWMTLRGSRRRRICSRSIVDTRRYRYVMSLHRWLLCRRRSTGPDRQWRVLQPHPHPRQGQPAPNHCHA